MLLVHRPYHELLDLQRELLSDAISAGNMPIDMLHCVPPSTVEQRGACRQSLLGQVFLSRQWEVWDGVDEKVRRHFPRSIKSFRIVQYESCRGLEGWTTILDGLDEAWMAKRDEALQGTMGEGDPAAMAWRWCMIPVTRPIDTLVITLRERQGPVAQVLSSIASASPDYVEVQY